MVAQHFEWREDPKPTPVPKPRVYYWHCTACRFMGTPEMFPFVNSRQECPRCQLAITTGVEAVPVEQVELVKK